MRTLMRTSALTALLAAVASLALAPQTARAALLTLDLDFEFSGGSEPAGTSPWLTATLDDSVGGANTVRVTMSAANLVGGEFAGKWYFNFDPALDSTLLSFVAVDNADSVPVIGTGVNAFKADGDGFFDIEFDFPLPPGSGGAKFEAGETVIYDLTYVAPISAASFDYSSVMGGGTGTYRSAAHVQGIGTGSGWVGSGGANGSAPEPATWLLLGIGALGLLLRRA